MEKIIRLAVMLNNASWLGKPNVHSLFGYTAINVGDEHGWETRRLILHTLAGLWRRATGHGDWSAVHVHLTIPDPIKPRPGQGILPEVNVLRDCELELKAIVGSSAPGKIFLYIRGAASFVRLNDLPFGFFAWH